MAKLTIEEIIATVKEMTVVELNDLVKAIENEFGVTAAAPVAGAAKYVGYVWNGIDTLAPIANSVTVKAN